MVDLTLSPDLAKTALRELNESPQSRRLALQELRKKIFNDQEVAVEDAILLRFLRCKKFDVSRSFSIYQGYHRFRAEHAELFDGLEPGPVRHVWESGVVGALKSRDKEGRSVMVGFPGRWDPREHSLDDVLRALVLQLEHLIESEETQINGIVLVADFTEFTFYQARCLKPWYFQMLASLVQNAFPARFKGVYIVNQPWYINILLSLVRPFLSKKMNSRINLLGCDIESLHSYIDPDTLPEELGGTLEHYDGTGWAETAVKAHERRKSASSIGIKDKKARTETLPQAINCK